MKDVEQKSRLVQVSASDSFGVSEVAGAICALGVFDGVHLGHRKIISDCVARSHELGAPSAIVTFGIDPEELFCKGRPRKLLSNNDRIEMLRHLGADMVVVLDFDEGFSKLSPEEFVSGLSADGHAPAEVIVGCDFRFGYRAAGDVGVLGRELGRDGCVVTPEDLLSVDGAPVTATRIRDLIESCDIEVANALMGRMHFIRSEVVMGRQVGRTLGFPTANLVPTENHVGLGGGVYIGYVLVRGRWYRACISVGVPKTFGDIPPTIEAHLVDFDDDIYGEQVVACFSRYLQPMERFNSPEELVERIQSYKEAAQMQPVSPQSLPELF